MSIYVGEDGTYAVGKPGVQVFPIPAEERDANQALIRKMTTEDAQLPFLVVVRSLMKLQQQYCNFLLQNTAMIQEISSADLIIGESLYPCGTLVADKFSLPHVIVNMGPVSSPFSRIFGVDPNPAYVPQMMTWLPANGMTFMQKIKNLGFYVTNIFIGEFIRYPIFKELKAKHNIKPNKSIKETLSTFDLVLLSSDFALDIAQPLPPSELYSY